MADPVALADASAAPLTRVAVRELCEFTAKRGDLDLRFTPAPSAQEGIEGHGVVTARRGAGYERELPLQARYKNLLVRGRADGLRARPLTLEEIKTYRGDLARMPDNHRHLHWAQLKVYGALLCAERGLDALRLSLVYYDVDKGGETPLTQTYAAADLQAYYEQQCEAYLAWDASEQIHKRARNAALAAVGFPHAGFHAGQRQLAEAVYRSLQRRQVLMAQAPTGIGKSIGTLFPALKAMAGGHLDKIFFLTAKTSGRQLALDALASLAPAGTSLPLRVLELVARDKACAYRDKACHGQSCPLARGFYDRLGAARADAVKISLLDQATLLGIALRHGVCPYYLSQDLVRWADVVVGDYNYYFDGSALMYGLTVINDWRVAVLVDEAHNLVERGRAMYSVALQEIEVPVVSASTHGPSSRALKRLAADWRALAEAQTSDYTALAEPPPTLVARLTQAVSAIGRYFTEHPEAGPPTLRRFYFDAGHFLQLAEVFGTHSIVDLQTPRVAGFDGNGYSTLSIRNVVPGPFLAPRTAAASGAVFFSATLNPPRFYRNLLGLGEAAAWLDVPSPFTADQLRVQVARRISTRYRDRAGSRLPIADLIAAQYRERPGNYLAFFSSYDYLGQISDMLAARHPDLPLHRQTSGMGEAEQKQFLQSFTPDSRRLGLAVLGGGFAEGIDLPGARLIGAFVVTLGLPQVNVVNELMRVRLDEIFGADAGYDYVYLYPGLQKVVQAAGRVIRTREDRGVVHLIDDRYTQRRVREVLPSWWNA